jgi:CRP/FNR family transcriptional regulator, cyclic AMP receptor protein
MASPDRQRSYDDDMATVRTAPSRRTAGAALLELDPELGCLLPPERHALALRELRVRVIGIPIGEWNQTRVAEADPTHFGILLVEGVLAREVVLMDTVSTELLGPGDVIRPWHVEGPPELLPVRVRLNALSDLRMALIDRAVSAQLGAYPEIGAVIVERMSDRAQRLAITQAISQLNRVDQRLLALFWHLAERWGRVAPNGINVPLTLSHRLLGELVGARRPTVSTALAELAREGQLMRRDDGTWMLTGEPLVATTDPAEAVRQRRRLVPGPHEPPIALPPGRVPTPRLEIIRASLAAAQEATRKRARDLKALQLETEALQARLVELRARRAERVTELREHAER